MSFDRRMVTDNLGDDSTLKCFAQSASRIAMFTGHPTDPGGDRWRRYVGFWRDLHQVFDVDIATTNYDDLLEQALPSLGQGFVPISGERVRRFDPRALDTATNRLVHLHGSIHFGERERDSDDNRFAYQDDRNDLYWHEDAAEARRAFKRERARPAPHRTSQVRQGSGGRAICHLPPLVRTLGREDAEPARRRLRIRRHAHQWDYRPGP